MSKVRFHIKYLRSNRIQSIFEFLVCIYITWRHILICSSYQTAKFRGYLCSYTILHIQFFVMASASSTSAKTLFDDSKMRLADRVQMNLNNICSLARQITRGSKSNEVSYFLLLSIEYRIQYLLL